MEQQITFQLYFEMENSLSILTRINSLLFRKRMYPLNIHLDFQAKYNTYKVKIKLQSTKIAADNLRKQIQRLVGVSEVSIDLL